MSNVTPVQKPTAEPFKATRAADYFSTGQFAAEIQQYVGYGNRQTGYYNLDLQQPLYPGLYLLGAISSLGKTTFTLQLADQAAALGQTVLYFSLEQSRMEMFSKSIARSFFETNRAQARANNSQSAYPTPSSMAIRRGHVSQMYPAEFTGEINRYANAVGNRMIMIDHMLTTTVEDIIGIVEQAISASNVPPLVIIDYLQIIAPTMVNGRLPDTKSAIDHIVHSLKLMQSQYNLPVIVVSSLNRANYMLPVDFESFKESGGIEYTADVVWGLQLAVLNDPDYQKEKSIAKQREMIKKAKAEIPRSIELVCLKNRYGAIGNSAYFLYFPANDCFIPR